MEKPNSQRTVYIIVGISLTIICCCIIAVIAVAYGLIQLGDQIPAQDSPLFMDATNTPAPTLTPAPPIQDGTNPQTTLETLQSIQVPENNPYILACRLQFICAVSETLPPITITYKEGNTLTFWAGNQDTNSNFQVEATLQYVTEHVYFWVDNKATFKQKDIERLVDVFEEKIYPTDRSFFGSEWTPGVDGDAHLYILYAEGVGGSVAGYFPSTDSYNPVINQYSNGHEMFVINASQNLADEFTYGVLAHEFQHMIHWNQDRNEEGWMNEGFSEVASLLNDYLESGFDYAFIQNPDMHLTEWPNGGDTTPHYGAAFLYLTYFLDRFGSDATQAVIKNKSNGLASIDETLEQLDIRDPLNGNLITADDVFIDWAITNYLKDKDFSDGRYTYNIHPNAPKATVTEEIKTCPQEALDFTVNQYGTDYIRVRCEGKYTLHFTGETQTRLIPQDALSGTFAFWSNKGDESDMTLTRQFDLSAVSSATLSYWVWYDIETDYDYIYVEASTDGEHWQILNTPGGTDYNPTGNALGWGYTGISNGWINETIDLSQFAGQNVYVRFEYVTDAVVNGEGFLLDDISIQEIGYATDFENGADNWLADGFARVENAIPQTFRIALISKGALPKVEYITLDPNNSAEISFEIGNGVDEVILVVSGTTRYTRSLAEYTIEVK